MASEEEQTVAAAVENTEESSNTTATTAAGEGGGLPSEAIIEQERSEKILRAKELYSNGSRNFLVKNFSEAADELSEVCALYGELYGELSDELGMPYLLYAKSLIALALDENKVIDVPDQEEDDDEDDEDVDEEVAEALEREECPKEATESSNGETKPAVATNDKKLEDIKEEDADAKTSVETEKMEEDTVQKDEKKSSNSEKNGEEESAQISPIDDGEKPSTSNGDAVCEDDDEENEAASNLQLAWEILELAAKIFCRQDKAGLPNLAEVLTELANIEFENNNLDSARDDYEKALFVYRELPNKYRRAMAEINYKIGLTFLMQQQNRYGAGALKEACNLIAGEINEIRAKTELSEKDKNNIQDMEETKQEIEAKIIEIEETQAQNIAEVRAALDSYIKPRSSGNVDAGCSKSSVSLFSATAGGSTLSSSSSAAVQSSKPTDISHLIKRKKPEESTSESEAAACSPAKRSAV